MANVRLSEETIEELQSIKALMKRKSINEVVKTLTSDKKKELKKIYKVIEYTDMSLSADKLYTAPKELSFRKMFCGILVDTNPKIKIFGYEDSVIKINSDNELYINIEEYESHESTYTMKVYTPTNIKRSDWSFLKQNDLDLEGKEAF